MFLFMKIMILSKFCVYGTQHYNLSEQLIIINPYNSDDAGQTSTQHFVSYTSRRWRNTPAPNTQSSGIRAAETPSSSSLQSTQRRSSWFSLNLFAGFQCERENWGFISSFSYIFLKLVKFLNNLDPTVEDYTIFALSRI